MQDFSYRDEQRRKRERAATGVLRSHGGQVQEECTHQLVASSHGNFRGGSPSNALSRAAWAHNGRAPGTRPR